MVEKLENIVRELEDKIELLKRVAMRGPDEIIIKKIDPLTAENLEKWKREFGLTKYDLILTSNVEISKNLISTLKNNALGIILIDTKRLHNRERKTLERNGVAVFPYDYFSTVIRKEDLIQKVKIDSLQACIQSALMEYLDEAERAYIEFRSALEEYRKRRLEELGE